MTFNGFLTLCFDAFLVQLDYVEGRRLSKAHRKNKQSGLIEEAEDISKAAEPLSKAEDEELEREVRKFVRQACCLVFNQE